MVGYPALYGARIVTKVLTIPELKQQWEADVKVMFNQLEKSRSQLVKRLEQRGSKHDRSHIKRHKGFFSFTTLNQRQIEHLLKKHHIYMQTDGRMAVTGLNSKNIDYVAEAFDSVTRFSAFN